MVTQFKLILSMIVLSLLLWGCGEKPEPKAEHLNVKELQSIDHVLGEGNKTRNSMRVAVHYTGWLYDENASDKKGKKFDSSHDRNRALVFSLGNKDVIQGWEQGLLEMRVGGKRTLIIPPHLGYGTKGAGSSIPPNAALVFDIELLQAG